MTAWSQRRDPEGIRSQCSVLPSMLEYVIPYHFVVVSSLPHPALQSQVIRVNSLSGLTPHSHSGQVEKQIITGESSLKQKKFNEKV